MGEERSAYKYAECKEGHLHAIKSQFLNDILIKNEPMSYMFYRDIAPRDRIFVSSMLKISPYECPINIVYLTNSLFESNYSIGDDDNASIKNAIDLLDENVLNVVKKRQDEILNDFKTETENLLDSLKQRFDQVHREIDDVVLKIKNCKINLITLDDKVIQLEDRVANLRSSKSSSSESNSDGSDVYDEIRAIRNDPKKTFLNYLKSNGKHWEIDQPIVIPVWINGFHVNAVYDPFVAKSIVSQDLLNEHDAVEDLYTEQVFYIPWRVRKFQSCYEASTVQISIRNHKHTLNVSVSPYWSRKILLGLNFGVKFVDTVKKKEFRAVLLDDYKNYFSVDFELFERAMKDDDAMST